MDPFKITQDCQVIGAFMDDSTEFVPLDRWIMESNTFNILRNYKFFREYYARRAIDQWIAFRKYRQFCKNRAEISFVSFTGKKKFLQFQLDIQKALVEIRDKAAIDIYANMDYNEQAQ